MMNEFATISLSPYVSVQGNVVARQAGGVVTVDTGIGLVTGTPLRRLTSVKSPLVASEASEPQLA